MENNLEKAIKFIDKIKENDTVEKYNKNKKQMKNLLSTIICELNPNIEKENIGKLDSSQLWSLISTITTKNINNFKAQIKCIEDIKDELQDYNNSNYLEKKRKRNKKEKNKKLKEEEEFINNEEEE